MYDRQLDVPGWGVYLHIRAEYWDAPDPDDSVKELDKAIRKKEDKFVYELFGRYSGSYYILIDKDSQNNVKIQGQFISSRIDEGRLWICYRDEDLGIVQRFCPAYIMEDIERELEELSPPDNIDVMDLYVNRRTELRIQHTFFRDIQEHYYAFGEKILKDFFEQGREIKKKNLNKTLREIADEMLIPDLEAKRYRSIRAGAEDYSRRFLSYGKEIKAVSLAQTVKNIQELNNIT